MDDPVEISASAGAAYIVRRLKYAMAGEGACFLTLATCYGERSATGCTAEFGASAAQEAMKWRSARRQPFPLFFLPAETFDPPASRAKRGPDWARRARTRRFFAGMD